MARDINDIKADLADAKARMQRTGAELTRLAENTDPDLIARGEDPRYERTRDAYERAQADVDSFDAEWRDLISRAASRGNFEGGGTGVRDGYDHRRGAYDRDFERYRDREDSGEISRAMRVLERDGRGLPSWQLDAVDWHLRRDATEMYRPGELARRINETENDVYRSAFVKYLHAMQTGLPPIMTAEEHDAVSRAQAREIEIARALGEVTSSAGGLAIPALIDPSVILTSGAADAPLLRYCRIETITNNLWKGVSSAGMTWSFSTESTEATDDSPTFSQPTVYAHRATGFIPYSIEVGQDWPGFASEMGTLLNQGYQDLLAVKTMTGTGTGEPYGIFTALDALTSSEVVVTSDGVFQGSDIFKVWNALPERARGNSVWVMSESVRSAIRQFAASTSSTSAYFSVDITGGSFRLNERPVVVTDYAPNFSAGVPGTTGAANILTVADWRRSYLVAQRMGMVIETIPHLFGTNGRPKGQRGLWAMSRVGAAIVDGGAHAKLLQNA